MTIPADNTSASKYEQLVVAKLAEVGDGYFDFDGNNCDECVGWNGGATCRGWDGESRRCSCGNRRVSWVLSDDETYVYAQAY